MQIVWRDNRTEYLPATLTLFIQTFVDFFFNGLTPMFWQLFMELKLLNEYSVVSQRRVNVAKKASCMPLFECCQYTKWSKRGRIYF